MTEPMSEEVARAEIQGMYDAAMQKLMANGARMVIMGGTGTGKTSVINAAFGQAMGSVSHAMPCTQSISHYPPTATCPVQIYDTKGFEPLSDNKDILEDLRSLYEERKRAASQYRPDSPEHHAERLHAVWWVTDVRLEPVLVEKVHDLFGNDMPIFIVVNKCDKSEKEVDEVVATVTSSCRWATAVVPVVATPKNGPLKKKCESCGSGRIMTDEDDKLYVCRNKECPKCREEQTLKPHYGIDELMEKTVTCLPDLVAASFQHVQKEWLGDLDTMADNRIRFYAALALTIGSSPIPFSDFPLLLANETAMFTNLAVLYGVKVDPTSMKEVLSSFHGVAIGAAAGLGLGSLLKLIPGVGSVLGGMADATIAVTVTTAIGFVVKELLRRVRGLAVFGEITSEHFRQVMGVDEMEQLFRQSLTMVRWGGQQGTQRALPMA